MGGIGGLTEDELAKCREAFAQFDPQLVPPFAPHTRCRCRQLRHHRALGAEEDADGDGAEPER
eukprot:170785-Hanusia_phi.AAC.1